MSLVGVLLAGVVPAGELITTNNPVADAHVRSGFSIRKNYGTEQALELQSSRQEGTAEAYLRFDLAGLDATSTTARLRIYARSSSPGPAPVLVRSVAKNEWAEKDINWRDKPEQVKTIGQFDVVGVSFAWYEFDLTAHVRSELTAGARQMSLALMLSDDSGRKVTIKSREAAAQRPELVTSRRDYNLKIAFLPPSGVLPAGYLPDNGRVFGDRGNGDGYGWSIDVAEFTRDRSLPAFTAGKPKGLPARDHRYEVHASMDHPGSKQAAFWEVAVANGKYKVHVVCGDPLYFDSVYALDIEGVLTVDSIPDTKSRWAEGNAVVTVKDGRLTVKNNPNASNNKICFIEIEPVQEP